MNRSLLGWRNAPTLAIMWLLGMAFTLLPESAHALVAGGFSCSDGTALGQLYDTGNGSCPDTMHFTNIFSFLICHTEQLSANLMGSMYCGVVAKLMPAVTAMVTLSVLFFGVSFTIGFTQITAKEFQAMLLKIALVYAFATQSDLLIGIGYNLLVTGLRDGTAIAVSSLYTANGVAPANGLGVYGLLDGFLAQALHFATDAVGQTWTQGQSPCKNAIFAVMVIMAFVLPPVFYMCVMLIIRIAVTFVRAVFGYLYSLIGIVFLLCLAPIFLSFYLFKQTQPFFIKWLNYLIAFSLQMVIVFAFLSFVVSIKVNNITDSLTAVIMPTLETKDATGFRLPWKYCTLCQFDVVDKTTGAVMGNNSPNFISNGKLQCHDNPPKPISVWTAASPDATSQEQASLIKFATHGLISLLVLALIVDALIRMIPSLALNLATGFDPTAVGVPGGQMFTSVERGFRDSFSKESNSVSGIIGGFKNAAQNLVTGKRDAQGNLSPDDPGLVGSFMDYIRDPQADDSKRYQDDF